MLQLASFNGDRKAKVRNIIGRILQIFARAVSSFSNKNSESVGASVGYSHRLVNITMSIIFDICIDTFEIQFIFRHIFIFF